MGARGGGVHFVDDTMLFILLFISMVQHFVTWFVSSFHSFRPTHYLSVGIAQDII